MRRAYGYCQRTARRFSLRRLVEDGEQPGLIVGRTEADAEHPQKRLRPLPPERAILRPAPPYASIGALVRLGTLGDPSNGALFSNPVLSISLAGVVVATEDNTAIGYGMGGFGTGGWSQ